MITEKLAVKIELLVQDAVKKSQDLSDKLDSVYLKSKIAKVEGKKSGEDIAQGYKKAADKIKDFGDNLKRSTSSTPGRSKALEKVQEDIEKTQVKLQRLKEQQANYAGPKTVMTDAYKKLQKDIQAAEKELPKLEAAMAKADAEKYTNPEGYKRVKKSAEGLRAELDRMYQSAMKMEDTGGAYTYSQGYVNLKHRIQDTEAELDKLKAKQEALNAAEPRAPTAYQAVASKAREIGTQIKSVTGKIGAFGSAGAGAVSKITGVAGGAINKLKGLGASIKNAFHGSNDSVKHNLKTILKYAFGIRSLYILVRRLKSAFKEGFGNLAEYSGQAKRSMDSLKGSMTQLKNSLAVAFAPIIYAVVPYIQTLINWLTSGLNAIAHFFAALTGQKTVTIAKTGIGTAAAAAGEAAENTEAANNAAKEYQKTLLGFDQANVLESRSSDSGSGSGGTGSPGTAGGAGAAMFETVDVDSKWKDWAEKIKEAWKNADFYDIGRAAGEKLKEGLENIDWDKINKTGEKVAKSLATGLNGFLETPGLFTKVGETVGNALNTVFNTANTFATTFHWDSLGKAIADSINGFFSTFKLSLAAETISNFVSGIFTALATGIGSIKWKTITNNITEGIDSIKWKDIQNSLNSMVKELAHAANDIFGDENLFESIGATFAKTINTIIGAADTWAIEFDWEAMGTAIGASINSFFANLDAKKTAKTISHWAAGLLKGLKAAVENVDWEKVGKSIAEFISNLELKDIVLNLGELTVDISGAAIDLLDGLSEGVYTAEMRIFFDENDSRTVAWVKLMKWLQQILLAGQQQNMKLMMDIIAKGPGIDFMDLFVENKELSKDAKINAVKGSEDAEVKKLLEEGKLSKEAEVVAKKANWDKGIESVMSDKTIKKEAKVEIAKGLGFDDQEIDLMLNPEKKVEKKSLLGLAKDGWKTITGWAEKWKGDALKSEVGLKKEKTWSGYTVSGYTNKKWMGDVTPKVDIGISKSKKWSGSSASSYLNKNWMGTVVPAVQIGLNKTKTWAGKTVKEWVNDQKGNGAVVIDVAMKFVDNFVTAIKKALGFTKAEGGLFKGGHWVPITAAAGGGAFDTGQFFLAREAGPELVGTIGGNTAVMNNDQIVASVSAGVFRAVTAAMRTSGGDKEIHIHLDSDAKKMFRVVQAEAQNYTNSTGMSAFPV